MKRIVTALLPPILFSGLSFAVLVYVAAFSVRQSIVLSIIMMLLGRYTFEQVEQLTKRLEDKDQNKKPKFDFHPYYLRIDPRWQQLLCDFHLIGSAEEWDQVKDAVYEALPGGFCCTILRKPRSKGENGLIYLESKSGEFVSAINFSEKIMPIRFGEGFTPDRLQIFVKAASNSYELGIIIPEKWWKQVKPTCPVPLQEESGDQRYKLELTLARISYAEFAGYNRPQLAIGSEYNNWREETAAQRSAKRNALGWKDSVPVEGTPVHIEHTYFEVQHSRI